MDRTDRASEADRVASATQSALRPHPGVAAAYLYGSVARGRFTSISDVDVAILFLPDIDFDGRRSIASRIAGDLSRAIPGAQLDVRDLDELPLAVQGRVLTEGRLLVSNDEPRRVRFEVAVRQRYFDFLPIQERLAAEGLRAMRERVGDG